MSFGAFLLQVLINPGKAFEQGKGRFLAASVLVGGLSGIAGAWLMRIVAGRELPFGMLRLTVISGVAFLIMSVLLHLIATNMSNQTGSYAEFLSLYGFTAIPGILSSLLMHSVSAFRLAGFRSPYYPGLVSFGSGWVIALLVFSSAMTIAGYIYQGLALSAVYRLRWTRIVGAIIIAAIVGGLVVSPVLKSFLHTVKVPWETAALMLDDVNRINIDQRLSFDAEWHRPSYEVGELVYLQFDTIHLNGLYCPIERQNRYTLAEIMALPGETVELNKGSLLVNGQVVRQASEPLPHLTLGQRTLRPNEYFVYFRSPQALNSNTDPQMFIVNKNRIKASVKQGFMDYVHWLTR